jgi:hypothetical protein
MGGVCRTHKPTTHLHPHHASSGHGLSRAASAAPSNLPLCRRPSRSPQDGATELLSSAAATGSGYNSRVLFTSKTTHRAVSVLTTAILFVTPGLCHSQRTGTRPSNAEMVHNLMQKVRPEDRYRMAFGDVEFVLKYGSPEQSETFFASIVNKPIEMRGATVVDAGKDWIRIAWDDGFTPSLQAFRFEFPEPLASLPISGQKVNLRGTYRSYSKDPLLITVTNSFMLPEPPPR